MWYPSYPDFGFVVVRSGRKGEGCSDAGAPERTAAHELGHIFGLAHDSRTPESLMSSTVSTTSSVLHRNHANAFLARLCGADPSMRLFGVIPGNGLSGPGINEFFSSSNRCGDGMMAVGSLLSDEECEAPDFGNRCPTRPGTLEFPKNPPEWSKKWFCDSVNCVCKQYVIGVPELEELPGGVIGGGVGTTKGPRTGGPSKKGPETPRPDYASCSTSLSGACTGECSDASEWCSMASCVCKPKGKKKCAGGFPNNPKKFNTVTQMCVDNCAQEYGEDYECIGDEPGGGCAWRVLL